MIAAQPRSRAAWTGEIVKVENYSERKIEIDGWPVNLTSYKIGDVYHCKADNVSPGAALARTTGSTQQEADHKAIARATELLGRTKRKNI
jgi:hypothetical protein